MDLGRDSNFAELIKTFRSISSDFDIDYSLLQPYIDSYCEKIKSSSIKIKSNNICRARKQDGLRCTRRCKDEHNFCGKHIKNQKFGCIQEIKDNHIELDEFKNKNVTYLIDIDSIIYRALDNGKYQIIGKKRKNGDIYVLEDSDNLDYTDQNITDSV